MSSSSSSLDRPRMNYDVFISFRGRDVRYTFVGYLYDALNRLGIRAFMDDKRLQYGDNLHDLFQIIDESRSAIVVLSEDYASAKWCLRELAKIMDSMGTTMKRVLPVFYHVEPSTVKDQSGTFKKSFDEHEVDALKEIENQDKDKCLKDLQNWKKAMKKIGNHTGVVITKNSSEVEVVKKIAQQIFDAWRPKLETFNKNLVGMTSRLLQMNMYLGLGLDDVRLIAIVGMGGIGKTTIAQVIFDCILSKFDDCCFLTLSRGDSKQSIVSLQREMLSQIFPTESLRIWHENHGLEMIKNRLSGRKVLIFLDGVEEKRQLEMLVGSIEWFGHGSRVIVTARNKGLLYHNNNVETKEYIVEDLDRNSAHQLFLQHAFGIKHQNKGDFMDLINEIVEKVKRLPLALRVIGSFFYGKEITIWRETSKRIIKVDERSLFDVLKISYDGLGVESQQVFLDLTCFFNGRSEDSVIEILESFGYSPKSEIQLLMQRCLIEVSHKKILVHDLILEMGREIVHKESLTQPGKQSRIWLHEDLYCKFAEKHELMYIQGIVLSLEKEMKESIQLEAKSFSELTKLRILEINNVELSEEIQYLSQLLRLINWPGCPLKCLPPTFQSRYLFELHLANSHMLHLWDGKKKFGKLKLIDVRNSEKLKLTPDFSEVPNLERLVLCNCVSLCEIHPSINCLNNLTLLDLEDCANLKLFPPNMRCKNLQTLVLAGTGLETSPEIGGIMERLAYLNLARSNIIQLHPSIQHLTNLIFLNLSDCIRLSSLPSEIGNLRSLQTLLLTDCRELDQIPQSLGNAESLETLSIKKTSISHIPSSMHCLKNLKTLECEGRLSCGIWKSLLPQFNDIIIDSPIKNSSTSLAGSLKTLSLIGYKLEDEDIPKDLHWFSSLETLDLSYNNFKTLPDSLSHIKKLKKLTLNYCTQLQDLPKLPESLKCVEGTECISISKKFYNKKMHVPSSSSKHTLFLHFPIHSKAIKAECSMSVFQHSMLDRRLFEERISDEQLYCKIYSDEDDILELFDQRNEGNWINIEYNHSDNNACGVYLLATIELDHLEYKIQFSLSFKIDGWKPSKYCVNSSNWLKFPATKCILVFYIPVKEFRLDASMFQNACSIKAQIDYDDIDANVKVKACGVSSILSWQNVSEFLAMLFTKVYSPNHIFHRIMDAEPKDHKRECRCDDELDVTNDYFSSSTFESDHYSTFLSRKNLISMLGRIFEGQKRFKVAYFFPHTKISGWFRNQSKKNKAVVKLPLNINKEKKLMGLAMFAVFSVSENTNCLCFDNLIQLGSSKSTWPSKNSIPMKFLEYSNQMLAIQFLSHNLEWFDEQNSSSGNHVYISFNTNVERMQVELCGARLVYYQNVEGLAHSIVDCIVESGDDLYEYYNQQILKNHLRMISFQKHQNSSLQVVSVNQQPTAALSCNHDSSLSDEHLLHTSFPHPLLHKSIQELFGSKFDLILHGEKIPKFFTNQSVGNMTGTKLTTCSFACECHVGIVVCALVVVDKQTGKLNDITERERYTKVVDLLCYFRVDSEEICPMICHFVSVRKLLNQYASKFIWLSYIPLTEFNIIWHNCNQLEVTLKTSYDELFQVQHCGVRLINTYERREIDKMIMESPLFHHQNT